MRWALGLALVVAAVWAVAGVVVLQRSGRHVHHEVAAQARSLSHWLDTRYRGGLLCSAAAHGGLLLPPPPPLVDAVASLLVNPSFSRQLAGWTSDGRSSVAVEQRSVDLNATAGHADSIVVDNHYWLASGGPVTADAAERPALPLACVWQDVSVRVLQRAAPSLNLVELLDAGRLMASASALLRRPTTDLGNWAVHRCAFRNRYCNAFFDDHVWLELAFLAGEGDEHDELRWTRDRSRAAADEAQAQALGLDAATASKTQQQQPVMTTATDAIILASAANSADTRGRVVESAAASAAELEQLGSVRSTIEEHVEWHTRRVTMVVPPRTRTLRVQVCSQHRAHVSNRGMADELALQLLRMPPAPSVACSWSKQPLLRAASSHGELGTVAVMWETSHSLRQCSVRWGWSAERLVFAASPTQVTEIDDCHFIHKSLLSFQSLLPAAAAALHDSPNARRIPLYYTIDCGTIDCQTEPHRINVRRANNPDDHLTIGLVGDMQYGSSVMSHIVQHLRKDLDLLVLVGDIVDKVSTTVRARPSSLSLSLSHSPHAQGSNIHEWAVYYWNTIEPIAHSVPVALVRGNHDGEHSVSYAYTALPDNIDYYASTYGRARLLFLNSNAHPIIAPRQTQWLTEELQSDASLNADFRYERTSETPSVALSDRL